MSTPKPDLPPLDPDLEHLSDEALVAILVGANAAKRLLSPETGAGSLQALARWSLTDLVHRGKVPEKRARELLAGLTAGRRGTATRPYRGTPVNTARQAYELLKGDLSYLQREKFVILLLDSTMRLISVRVVSTGTLNATMVHPRDVFSVAVTEHAHTIILAHNHPSGRVDPSQDDISLTRRLVQAGDTMGVHIADHVIVGDNDFYSFAENGTLRG